MEKLYIPATKYTPEILLDPDRGLIEFKGKSYPENTFEFYKPVLKWIEEYLKCCAKGEVTVNMEIIYFNSSTSKLFFDLFDMFDEARKKCKVTINWIYDKDNESAEEAGKDFIEDFKDLKINLIKK